MKDIIEMREKRATLVNQGRELLDRAEAEKRSLHADEEQQYDNIMAEVDKLGKDIDREEKQQALENQLNQSLGTAAGGKGQPAGTPGTTENPRATAEYRAAYERFLVSGPNALSAAEFKNMAADPDAEGGFLIMPQQMVDDLLKDIDDAVFIRQISRSFQLKQAKSLGVPTIEEDLDDWEWTTELKTGNNDDMKFGKRELRPHPLAKRVKISNTLLRLTGNGAESIVRERLAYKLAATLEKNYLFGDGNAKPLGLFTASDDGISTARDVATDNTATAVTGDGLINALYSLKEAYQRNARWMFHRDVIKQIRKLKNAVDGTYLWQPGITGGAPDRILEKPYIMSEFAPNTMTSGKYVGLIGDFQYFWYVDALDMGIQRLVELYAEANQTGFIGRYEGDAMPIQEKAFARVKLG